MADDRRHDRRADFLKTIVATGILAADAERRLLSLRRRVPAWTVSDADRLRRATRAVEFVHRTLAGWKSRGIHLNAIDFPTLPDWPDAAECAAILAGIRKVLRHGELDAPSFDPDKLDLATFGDAEFDARKLALKDYRL